MTDLGIMEQGVMVTAITGWIAILAFAALRGWSGWLALKRAELELTATRPLPSHEGALPSAAARIELADLKERIRKLEAIAAGIDL